MLDLDAIEARAKTELWFPVADVLDLVERLRDIEEMFPPPPPDGKFDPTVGTLGVAAYWQRRAEIAEERVRELEATAGSPADGPSASLP